MYGAIHSHLRDTIEDPAERERGKIELVRSVYERWIAFGRDCEAQFVDDVAAQLAPPQADQWQQMHAEFRRDRMLECIAERLNPAVYDLAPLLQAAGIRDAENAELRELIAAYHSELDAAIDDANARHPMLEAEHARIEQREGRASPAALAALARVQELGAAVARASERALPRFLDTVTVEEGVWLRDALNRRLYPGVYHESPAERLRTLLGKLDDLSEESRAQLEAIFVQYAEREQHLRRQLVEAVERWRAPANADWLERRRNELREEGRHPLLVFEDHPALPLFEQQSQLVKGTVQRVRALFPSDEFAQLPPQTRILTFWVE